MSENGLKTEFYTAEVQENACKLYRTAVALTSHAIERRIARVQVARRQYPERVGRWNRWLRHRPNEIWMELFRLICLLASGEPIKAESRIRS